MSIPCFSLGFAVGMMGRDFLGLIGDAFNKKETPKALPIPATKPYQSSYTPKKEDKKMMGWLTGGSGEKKDTRPAVVQKNNPEGGLWGYKSAVTSQALQMGKSVEMDLQSFDNNGTPYRLQTRIR